MKMARLRLFRYQEELDKHIEFLRLRGFDSIRFPGGTSKNGRHSAFVIFKIRSINEDYHLVVPYNSSFHLQENVETSNEYENPKRTAVREFKEEVRVKIDATSLEFYNMVSVPDNSGGKKMHKKYFYRYKKEIVDFLQYSLDFGEEEEETSTPFFIKSSLLRDNLFEKHYQAFSDGWRKQR